MVYPQIPLWGVILFPLLFIFLIVFTDIRYDFTPDIHIGNGTTFAAIVVGFILLYAMQKYDNIDLNVPSASRGLLYLKKIANKYEPKSICYLIDYVNGFINIDTNDYSLLCFERIVVPLIDNEAEKDRVKETVTILNDIYFNRVSQTNVIAEPIWYLVFLSAILLTIIFPMNEKLKRMDSILVLLLIWLPITIIYAIYLSENQALLNIMEETLNDLKLCSDNIDGYCESLNCRYKCKPNKNCGCNK